MIIEYLQVIWIHFQRFVQHVDRFLVVFIFQMAKSESDICLFISRIDFKFFLERWCCRTNISEIYDQIFVLTIFKNICLLVS